MGSQEAGVDDGMEQGPTPADGADPVGSDPVGAEQELVAWLRTDVGRDALPASVAGNAEFLARFRELRDQFQHLQLLYRFGIAEVSTKIDILRQEFESLYDYSPIEHVRSRLKSPESLVAKALRQGTELTVPAIRAEIRDIAGIRITCSFVSDVYWIAEMLSTQADLRLLTTKDYIASPKPSGYRSLHLIVEVPVFLSRTVEHVPVELQIRTIAMDFWASMEHKLHYKYRTAIPPHIAAEIDDAARVAAELDERMGRLRDEVRPPPQYGGGRGGSPGG